MVRWIPRDRLVDSDDVLPAGRIVRLSQTRRPTPARRNRDTDATGRSSLTAAERHRRGERESSHVPPEL